MWTVAQTLQKKLVYSIPAAMVLGMAAGLMFDPAPLKAAIMPLTILMIYPMMVTLNIKSVFSTRFNSRNVNWELGID